MNVYLILLILLGIYAVVLWASVLGVEDYTENEGNEQ